VGKSRQDSHNHDHAQERKKMCVKCDLQSQRAGGRPCRALSSKIIVSICMCGYAYTHHSLQTRSLRPTKEDVDNQLLWSDCVGGCSQESGACQRLGSQASTKFLSVGTRSMPAPDMGGIKGFNRDSSAKGHACEADRDYY
jgi:hypothetical protein